MGNFLRNLTTGGKALLVVVIMGLLYGVTVGYKALFPKKAKEAVVTTKATGLPPLKYDVSSNATFRTIPSFNEAADVQAPEVRGAIMAWNGFSAASYSIGGISTAKGSIAEELGLNIRLSVQNSCTEQMNQLYAFAEALHAGEANPTKGVHFVNWMADGAPNYLQGLNTRLKKDFGDEYRAEIVTFTGWSFGEDKWLIKKKYIKDARGSLNATVVRDGDWNIIVTKSQLMGWDVNHDLGTYDPKKVNIVAAPNDDYVEAGKMYLAGTKVTLKLVKDGKVTDIDTTMTVSGVSSWFPVDQQLVQNKGGLLVMASTKDYASQMGCGIVMIKKWADDNRPIVEKMIEAFGRGGDQIKSHDEALRFAAQVNEVVFQDKEKDADAWYNAYKSFKLTDDDGNEVEIGGSRAANIADAANYVGVIGTDEYKSVYNTFGNISKEAFPEVLSEFPAYEEATDWSFLKAVFTRTKQAGTAGNVSKTDFSQAKKGDMIGDASYSVEFNTGSAVILPSSYATLNKIKDQLIIASNAFVEVAGHTDNVGNSESNIALSRARAKAVSDYLKSETPELGTQGRITTNGYGSSKPLPGTDPNSKADQAKNRRVEIKLFRVGQ